MNTGAASCPHAHPFTRPPTGIRQPSGRGSGRETASEVQYGRGFRTSPCTHIHIRTHTHARTHTQVHACAHARTHTHTHTHTDYRVLGGRSPGRAGEVPTPPAPHCRSPSCVISPNLSSGTKHPYPEATAMAQAQHFHHGCQQMLQPRPAHLARELLTGH